MDFGDHEVEAIHDVVNGSLFKHRYAATGEYNVSGKMDLASYLRY